MPTPLASATKANVRNFALDVEERMPGTMTSAGVAGGTTSVDADRTGFQVDFFRDKFQLLNSGTASGQWRRISNFASGSGTFTLVPQFGTAATPVQVASAVTYEVHVLPPSIWTVGANRAIREVYRLGLVHRPLFGWLIPLSERSWYDIPLARDIHAVYYAGPQALTDRFNRANSTTDPGNGWTNTSGVAGISSERLYWPTGTNGNHVTRDLQLFDGFIRAIVYGTLASATTYDTPALTFRIGEDRNGDIDTNNYLLVRLLNSVVDLRKVDGGTETSLTTAATTTANATDYVLQVQFTGPWIRIWVDGTLLINYELTGLNLKYAHYLGSSGGGGRVGIREDRAGSPATELRVDDYAAYHSTLIPCPDWVQEGAGNMFRITRRLSEAHALYVEGKSPLSTLAEDTTYGTLATDTTATLELETSDPTWELFITKVREIVYRMATNPAWNGNWATIPEYDRKWKEQRALFDSLSDGLATPVSVRPLRHMGY